MQGITDVLVQNVKFAQVLVGLPDLEDELRRKCVFLLFF